MTRDKTFAGSVAPIALALLCHCGDQADPGDAGDASGSSSGAVTEAGSDSGTDVGSDAGSQSDGGANPDSQADSDANADEQADGDANPDAPADAVAAFGPPFLLGVDITFTQEDEANGATYADNGTPKPILQLLKDHGFNYIRLRTFVDPTQAAPNPQGGAPLPPYSTQGFGDLPHTIAFGQQIKAAGMGFLLDFHYSDTWADPGKQIKPSAWVGDDVSAAANHLHDYTMKAVQSLVAAGARPDMVQVGNEITPGILLTPGTALGPQSATGWPQLATLLKAGVAAVHEVDPTIQIMLHLDRGGDLGTSIAFINSALSYGVPFDVFGESCYVAYQGPPSAWQATFNGLAARFPNLKFVMAEYNSDPSNPTDTMLRQANDIVFNLPNHQGLGTFFWEPTRSINAGNHGMFTVSGEVFSPVPACIDQYDQMKIDYGL